RLELKLRHLRVRCRNTFNQRLGQELDVIALVQFSKRWSKRQRAVAGGFDGVTARTVLFDQVVTQSHGVRLGSTGACRPARGQDKRKGPQGVWQAVHVGSRRTCDKAGISGK